MDAQHREIEARFLEINKEGLLEKLRELKADDQGENLVKEYMFYDRELKWNGENKFIRLRQCGEKTTITYKHHAAYTIDGTEEIEIITDSFEKSRLLLEKTGLLLTRRQEKKRHTFLFDGVTIDIDTWPRIPTYAEIEGPSEALVKAAAECLGFYWKEAVFESAGRIIENKYSIPVLSLSYFTFDRIE